MGTDGILENFGDAPFVRGSVEPHIVSMMTVIALKLIGFGVGIVLRNDARSALHCYTGSISTNPVNVHTGAARPSGADSG